MKYSSLLFTPLLFIVCAGLFAACSTPLPLQGCDDPRPEKVRGQETGVDFCANEPLHRVKPLACAVFEAPAACKLSSASSPSCKINADCNVFGIHTVCVDIAGSTGCDCHSTCVTDNECGVGKLCRCSDHFAICQTAFCRSDSDCEEGHMCMSAEFKDTKHDIGFACQSELDECLLSTHCRGRDRCLYDKEKGHRICLAPQAE